MTNKIFKIAHRGAMRYAPENSLEAFKKALEMGVDAVEFDLQRTKDGNAIVIHDETVDRTTDGSGLVREFTFDEIRKLRQKNGEPLPSLEEALSVITPQATAKIEIKAANLEEYVVKTLDKYNVQNVIICSAFSPIIKKIKLLAPSIKTELIFEKETADEIILKAKEVGVEFIAPHFKLVTADLIKMAHENGLYVHTWVVNNAKIIAKMKMLGIDGITGDFPELL